MAGRVFTKWSDLEKAVMKEAKAALGSDAVAQEAKEWLMLNVMYEVLDVYNPTVYRRRARGGLEDPKTYRTYLSGNLSDGYTLGVTNVAKPESATRERYGWREVYRTPYEPKDSRLLQWIEYGSVKNKFNGYNGYAWTRPRPALSRTQADFNQGVLWPVLEKELRARLG